MPEIPEIGVNAIGVPMISVGQPIPPPVLPSAPPVTSAAFPVIDMPGCVRARLTTGKGVETFEDDPRGTVTLCDGAVPIFEAPDYRPRDFTWVKPPEAPIKRPELATPTLTPLPKESGLAPDESSLPKNLPCPPIGAKEIGSFNKIGTRVITGYELQDGQCVTLWESVAIEQVVRNYIPEAGPTVMVSITAATATMFALYARSLASILQKAAKPVTKKVVKKINQRLGHMEKRESVRERRSAQRYRNEEIRDLRRALGR
jgi:hypothetical protein